jgi:hypothetical protein
MLQTIYRPRPLLLADAPCTSCAGNCDPPLLIVTEHWHAAALIYVNIPTFGNANIVYNQAVIAELRTSGPCTYCCSFCNRLLSVTIAHLQRDSTSSNSRTHAICCEVWHSQHGAAGCTKLVNILTLLMYKLLPVAINTYSNSSNKCQRTVQHTRQYMLALESDQQRCVKHSMQHYRML